MYNGPESAPELGTFAFKPGWELVALIGGGEVEAF